MNLAASKCNMKCASVEVNNYIGVTWKIVLKLCHIPVVALATSDTDHAKIHSQ